MVYRVSLSRIFKEHLLQVKEFDTIINSKKIIQNTKQTAKELEKMGKSGISIQPTRIISEVDGTNYRVVYKVINNPHPKIIARRIIRHR